MKKKILIYLVALSAIVALVAAVIVYRNIFGAAIKTKKEDQVIFIPTGSSYKQVLDTLKSNLTIKKPVVFEWLAKKKKYPSHIKSGR